MPRPILYICCLSLLLVGLLLPASATAGVITTGTLRQQNTQLNLLSLLSLPAVDPNYIYDQLFYLATHFQHREAGYDNNLPVSVNGHDEFAAYWSQEIVRDLQGFGPQVLIDKFPLIGWKNRPATMPAFNVEVSVAGMAQPGQTVVVGCHYDGEAVSTQSANDDTSGCAIALGVAKAMGNYWRSTHLYPARTIRFVLFDAEEQGIFGSFHYVNSTLNGDISNVVAMFNEEQSGIAYPVRFLGKQSNPLLPLHVDLTPANNNNNYFFPQEVPTVQQFAQITHFRALMQQAVPSVFEQFRNLGYQSLTYHSNSTNNKQDMPQPVFTADQLSNIIQEDDAIPSDETPFIEAGVPCATFGGNASYYDKKPPPAAWSYPFDQPQDTIQMMNTFADGSSQQSQALSLALALPGMLTTWMLNEPDVLGHAQAINEPIATMNDIGQTQVGHSIAFSATQAISFNGENNASTYSWEFGDGTTAQGINVSHIYKTIGNYVLVLNVTAAGKTRSILKLISIVAQPTSYYNFFVQLHFTGDPLPNPLVTLPKPDNSLTDRVIMVPVTTPSPPPAKPPLRATTATNLSTGLIVAISVFILLLVIGGTIFVLRRMQIA